MKKKSKFLSLIAVFGFPVFALAAPIKIGVAGPFTGPYAAYGEQLWHGAELAMEAINSEGGIHGNKIELIRADDACEPKQAVGVANRLVDNDKVQAVIGHFCSSSTIPASMVYSDAGILMITPASTNPFVTERHLPTIMRMCGRDDQQGIVAAEFIAQQLKAKQVAVIHDKDTYGKGLADAMKERLEELGIIPVLYEGLTRGEKDFNALVTKIKEVKAEVVYFGGLYPEAGPLLRQIREQGINAIFVSGDGIVSHDFVTVSGGQEIVDGVFMTFGRDPRTLSSGQSVVLSFRKSGFEPEGYTLYAYATLQVIATAMKNAANNKGETLAAWLKSHSVPTIMGNKAWDEKGDLKELNYLIYEWDNKGEYAEYQPPVSKTSKK